MPEEPPTAGVGSDEDYSDAPAAAKKRKKVRQDHFSYHVTTVVDKLKFVSSEHPSCSILLAIDSPFAHNSFRVAKSRHSTGDTTWDIDFEAHIKAAIQHKTFHPQQTLSNFLSRHTPTPITEERLLAAMRQSVQEGNLAKNQYDEILRTVEKMEKEENEKAKQSE
jgi:hypothetical protein